MACNCKVTPATTREPKGNSLKMRMATSTAFVSSNVVVAPAGLVLAGSGSGAGSVLVAGSGGIVGAAGASALALASGSRRMLYGTPCWMTARQRHHHHHQQQQKGKEQGGPYSSSSASTWFAGAYRRLHKRLRLSDSDSDCVTERDENSDKNDDDDDDDVAVIEPSLTMIVDDEQIKNGSVAGVDVDIDISVQQTPSSSLSSSPSSFSAAPIDQVQWKNADSTREQCKQPVAGIGYRSVHKVQADQNEEHEKHADAGNRHLDNSTIDDGSVDGQSLYIRRTVTNFSNEGISREFISETRNRDNNLEAQSLVMSQEETAQPTSQEKTTKTRREKTVEKIETKKNAAKNVVKRMAKATPSADNAPGTTEKTTRKRTVKKTSKTIAGEISIKAIKEGTEETIDKTAAEKTVKIRVEKARTNTSAKKTIKPATEETSNETTSETTKGTTNEMVTKTTVWAKAKKAKAGKQATKETSKPADSKAKTKIIRKRARSTVSSKNQREQPDIDPLFLDNAQMPFTYPFFKNDDPENSSSISTWSPVTPFDIRYLQVETTRKIRSLGQERKWEEAVRLFAKCSHKNEYMWAAVITACARSAKWEVALELLERMKTLAVTHRNNNIQKSISTEEDINGNNKTAATDIDTVPFPDAVVYNAAINACAESGRWREAVALLHDMENLGVAPDLITYNSCISACEKGRNWKIAVSLLDELERKEKTEKRQRRNNPQTEKPRLFLAPDIISYNSCISACEKANQKTVALELFKRLKSKSLELKYITSAEIYLDSFKKTSLRPNVITYSACISACEKQGDWKTAIRLFNEMQTIDNLAPNHVTYNACISACAKGGQSRMALALFREMKRKNVKITRITYNSCIDACAQSGKVDRALLFLNEMKAISFWGAADKGKDDNVSPDVISYTSCINACAVAKRWELAVELLQEMKDEAIKQNHPNLAPNSMAYNCCIKACAKQGEYVTARKLLDEMKAGTERHPSWAPIRATVISYSTCMLAYEKKGMWKETIELLKEMKDYNLALNEVVYNVCMSAHIKGGNYAGAVRLFKELTSRTDLKLIPMTLTANGKLKRPQSFSYHLCIRAYLGLENWQEAVSLFEKMREINISPRPGTFVLCIKALLKLGMHEKASKLSSEMKEQQRKVVFS